MAEKELGLGSSGREAEHIAGFVGKHHLRAIRTHTEKKRMKEMRNGKIARKAPPATGNKKEAVGRNTLKGAAPGRIRLTHTGKELGGAMWVVQCG